MYKRNFPSFMEAFMEYSKDVGAPKRFLLWSAISGISAALERKTWVRFGTQYIYPNQFIMLIADSGIARKSTAARPIVDMLSHVDGIKDMSTQLSAASLIDQLRDAGNEKTFEIGAAKYKNASLFAFASEAKTTIGEKNGLDGIQELLTDLYDCGKIGPWSEKPSWSKKTLSGGKIDIYNPCLKLLACSTPIWLNEAIGKSGIEGGFASRVIFVVQREPEGAATGWIEDDTDSKGDSKQDLMREMLIQDLRQINKLQGGFSVDTTTGWSDTFREYQVEFNRMAAAGGEMKSYYARKLWHCLKLAQVLAADQSDSLVLCKDHLVAARALLEEIEMDMYSTFQARGENKNLTSLLNVWEIMRRKKSGIWNKRELMGVTFKHANSAQLDDHLRTLSQMGKIKFIQTIGMISYQILDSTQLDRQSATV